MKKLEYKDIKEYIESFGYKLLSKEYVNNSTKLETICPNGNIYKVSYNKFKFGRRCECCRKLEIENNHKKIVNDIKEYEHIKTYFKGDVFPDGKIANNTYLLIKHLYCGSEYIIKSINFINLNQRCSKCCGSYKNSFAYYIENELNEPLEKYWDFDKNTVNPYHISKGSNQKVWIRCTSEEINESNGLMKKEYHDSYEIACANFINGNRCGYCNSNGYKIHVYDSFGYNNFDKVCVWHKDNKISPFNVFKTTHKKYKFTCEKCGNEFELALSNSSNGRWCPKCSNSKGEDRVEDYLIKNNIKYIPQKRFDDLRGVKNGLLSYDFYLTDYDILIEYQGKQHEVFIPGIHKTKEVFEKQIEHDVRKYNYAKDNNMKLLQIWYWNYDNVEEILDEYII